MELGGPVGRRRSRTRKAPGCPAPPSSPASPGGCRCAPVSSRGGGGRGRGRGSRRRDSGREGRGGPSPSPLEGSARPPAQTVPQPRGGDRPSARPAACFGKATRRRWAHGVLVGVEGLGGDGSSRDSGGGAPGWAARGSERNGLNVQDTVRVPARFQQARSAGSGPPEAAQQVSGRRNLLPRPRPHPNSRRQRGRT